MPTTPEHEGPAGSTKARAVRKRPKDRRQQLLRAALELFRERGFAATGIDDIGEAAGIAGPSVYRHFPTKQDILVEAMNQIADRLYAGTDGVSDLSPEQALEQMLTSYVDAVVADGAAIVVWLREQRMLPDHYQFVARRRQRLFIEEWVLALTHLRPELSETEARAVVHAAMSVVHSAALFNSGLEPDRLGEFLVQAAKSVLKSPLGPPAGS